MTQQIGVVGLAVMGKTSFGILNHAVIAFLYITVQAKTDEMVNESKGKQIHPTYSLEEFVNSLENHVKFY